MWHGGYYRKMMSVNLISSSMCSCVKRDGSYSHLVSLCSHATVFQNFVFWLTFFHSNFLSCLNWGQMTGKQCSLLTVSSQYHRDVSLSVSAIDQFASMKWHWTVLEHPQKSWRIVFDFPPFSPALYLGICALRGVKNGNKTSMYVSSSKLQSDMKQSVFWLC